MDLNKKKELAKRTLGVGKKRIIFLESRLAEIKDAITKQDIRDLHNEGAIAIANIAGRKRLMKKKKKKSVGKVRKKVNRKKAKYVILVRKLRQSIASIKKSDKISREDYLDIRKKIKNKFFKSKAHLKDYVGGLKE